MHCHPEKWLSYHQTYLLRIICWYVWATFFSINSFSLKNYGEVSLWEVFICFLIFCFCWRLFPKPVPILCTIYAEFSIPLSLSLCFYHFPYLSLLSLSLFFFLSLAYLFHPLIAFLALFLLLILPSLSISSPLSSSLFLPIPFPLLGVYMHTL